MAQAPQTAAPSDSMEAIVNRRTDFTRMDLSTREQWQVIGEATVAHQPNVAKRMLDMLKSFEGVHLGFGVDQLHHMLQTATMAKRANAKDEIILCALVHDVGKFVSVVNHGNIAAEMLKPYVSADAYQVVKTHQDFQGKHYYEYFGMAGDLRERYRKESWFELACEFTDEWDQAAFDPAYPVLPLSEFEPLVYQYFARFPGS